MDRFIFTPPPTPLSFSHEKWTDRQTDGSAHTHTYVRTSVPMYNQTDGQTHTLKHTHTHTHTQHIVSMRHDLGSIFVVFTSQTLSKEVEGKVKLTYAKPGQTKSVYPSTSSPASAPPPHEIICFNSFWLEMSLFTNIAKFSYLLFWRL